MSATDCQAGHRDLSPCPCLYCCAPCPFHGPFLFPFLGPCPFLCPFPYPCPSWIYLWPSLCLYLDPCPCPYLCPCLCPCLCPLLSPCLCLCPCPSPLLSLSPWPSLFLFRHLCLFDLSPFLFPRRQGKPNEYIQLSVTGSVSRYSGCLPSFCLSSRPSWSWPFPAGLTSRGRASRATWVETSKRLSS